MTNHSLKSRLELLPYILSENLIRQKGLFNALVVLNVEDTGVQAGVRCTFQGS
jgi:hypothetical protein